jgi:chromosome partitioning protein
LKQIKASDFDKLDIIPAHISFRHFDVLLQQLSKRQNRLRQALKGLKKEYDLVILDCPPTISKLAENIFNAADLVLVPVIPTTLSERTFDQLTQFFKQEDYNRKKLIPFFTMVDARKQLHKQTAISMRKRYKRFLRNAIPFSTDVERMGKYRAPIDIFARGKQANKAYLALWKEIQQEMQAL